MTEKRKTVRTMSKSGVLLVISGPSGGGKGTVVKRVVEKDENIGLSVSATTRAPRTGEEDGVHYHFVTREKFTEMLSVGEILEHAEYCGNFYGTPKAEADRAIAEGRDLILEIEVDGASQIKKMYPDAVLIMLIPPSLSVLEERLRGRGTEAEETIAKRLARASEEIELCENYDYIVVNDEIESCADEILAIVTAEHAKTKRMNNTINNFLK